MSMKITSVDYFVLAADLRLRQTCLFHSEIHTKQAPTEPEK